PLHEVWKCDRELPHPGVKAVESSCIRGRRARHRCPRSVMAPHGAGVVITPEADLKASPAVDPCLNSRVRSNDGAARFGKTLSEIELKGIEPTGMSDSGKGVTRNQAQSQLVG